VIFKVILGKLKFPIYSCLNERKKRKEEEGKVRRRKGKKKER